jgi:hypothetical protein
LLFLRDSLVLHVCTTTHKHVRRSITGTHGRFPCTYHCAYVALEAPLAGGPLLTLLAREVPLLVVL